MTTIWQKINKNTFFDEKRWFDVIKTMVCEPSRKKEKTEKTCFQKYIKKHEFYNGFLHTKSWFSCFFVFLRFCMNFMTFELIKTMVFDQFWKTQQKLKKKCFYCVSKTIVFIMRNHHFCWILAKKCVFGEKTYIFIHFGLIIVMRNDKPCFLCFLDEKLRSRNHCFFNAKRRKTVYFIFFVMFLWLLMVFVLFWAYKNNGFRWIAKTQKKKHTIFWVSESIIYKAFRPFSQGNYFFWHFWWKKNALYLGKTKAWGHMAKTYENAMPQTQFWRRILGARKLDLFKTALARLTLRNHT